MKPLSLDISGLRDLSENNSKEFNKSNRGCCGAVEPQQPLSEEPMKNIIKITALILAVFMLISVAACGKEPVEIPEETGKETEFEPIGETNIELEEILPEHINPLTGMEATYDVDGKRPIAVMLNNIYQALPQVGISDADVLFECLAEGGITRLMGVFSEYNNLGIIGSVRSSRPYYLDFAQMFDAVYCHAGGSEDAYSQIASRGINNIDGVRGDPLGVYYRDQERMQTMSYEHTMMTTGQGIIDTIAHCNFRTELREDFKYPFEFCEYGASVQVGTNDANHVYLPISNYQTVDYVYDSEAKEYLRYQYNGNKHIDGENGVQLSFKNIIIMFCDTAPYDTYGRLRVTTTGSGSGYVVSEGKYKAITWSRQSIDGNLTLTDSETGENLVINRGKTFINVCPTAIVNEVDLNAQNRTVGN